MFGGIECGNPHNAFLQEVPDSRAATLNPILQQFVAEGSMVNTDLWAAYSGIEQLPEGYGHATANQCEFCESQRPCCTHTRH